MKIEDKVFWGVDPGASKTAPGAVAVMSQDGRHLAVEDWPGDEVALAALVRGLLWEYGRPALVAVEKQQSMPKQGVASVFALGLNFGQWLGVLAGQSLAVVLVRPCEWKKGYVPAGADKSESVAVVRRRWPSVPIPFKKNHGRAEAVLLADVARRRWLGEAGAGVE